jgi:hypothetical protein
MGTRSLTYVYDGQAALVCMYRQFDGYLAGHGTELADFLSGFEIVNGYGSARPKLANGMGCLAAQLIANFKVGTGGFYLVDMRETDHCQEYEYHVYENRVVVKNPGEVIFDGTYDEFAALCNAPEIEEV